MNTNPIAGRLWTSLWERRVSASVFVVVAGLAVLVLGSAASATTTPFATASYSYDRAALNAQVARANAHAVSGPIATRAAREPAQLPTSARVANFLAAEEGFAAIKTPYGVAKQADDVASLALREQTKAGGTVYRQGTFGVQETTSGQFWAGENPLTTSGYANSYGTPGSAAPDWVMGGTVRPGAPFVTRPAPGLGANLGGAPEVVVNPGDGFDLWFHMP